MNPGAVPALVLLAMTPPPPPVPIATRDMPVCRLELEVPRGGIVVGKVCHVAGTTPRCDGGEVATVPEQPGFGEKTRSGSRGVLVVTTGYWIREERYATEVRYMLVSSLRPDKHDPYLSLASPIPAEVVTRACPEESLYLDRSEDVVVFAAGTEAAKVGTPLGAFGETNPAGSWLVAVFSRMR